MNEHDLEKIQATHDAFRDVWGIPKTPPVPKVVQIVSMTNGHSLIALCSDGRLFRYVDEDGRGLLWRWEEIPSPC
jgi:hypothetical protein